MKNKEYGSDFHLIELSELRLTSGRKSFFDESTKFYFSGRAALRSILINGVKRLEWKKLFIPTYYCHEVYDYILDIGINFEFYNCNPLRNELPLTIDDNKNNVILLVNYFGLGTVLHNHLKDIVKIEDLTHDLEAINFSSADYVFGSLRKVLPSPVGGFLKCKDNLLEPPQSKYSLDITELKIRGMRLKKDYLNGEFNDKNLYRNILTKSEDNFSNLKTFSPLSDNIKSFICNLDIDLILNLKKNNSLNIKNNLKLKNGFRIISSPYNNEFALIFKFNTHEDRERLKNHLINLNIYPFVLWPKQFNGDDINLMNTLLFIHIDFRYNLEDINFISSSINQYYLNAF